VEEVRAIKRAATLTFGKDSVVRLYGSRAFDDRRGGDIDLHIETVEAVDILQKRADFLEHLFARLDYQRVDVIATQRGSQPRPIEAIAYRDGVIL
jgi:predicted nucleotidyltransferase